LIYAALHGANIPGGIWLDEAKVRAALHRLPPSMTFLRIVGRPDSILLVVDSTTTEEDTRRAVSAAVGCRCVAISTALLSRILDGAVAALRASGESAAPPYPITTEGAEWEWCLVLSADTLPNASGSRWLFEPTPTVVALAVLERRALLARKRRFNQRGKRIMLGNRLLDPWRAVIDANGAAVECLTSRTLNRAAGVVEAAARAQSGDSVRGPAARKHHSRAL
jgi:hypothetical protein